MIFFQLYIKKQISDWSKNKNQIKWKWKRQLQDRHRDDDDEEEEEEKTITTPKLILHADLQGLFNYLIQIHFWNSEFILVQLAEAVEYTNCFSAEE